MQSNRSNKMTFTKQSNVCVLCLKRFDGTISISAFHEACLHMSHIGLGEVYPTTEEDIRDTGQMLSCHQHDLYSRFLLFTGRFFKMSSSEILLQFAKEHKNTTGENVQALCGNCHALVSHVCDLYAELQTVKLHLLKKVDDLGKVTKLSTKAVSLKLLRGLMKTVAEQLNIKTVRQLELYRKSLILNCKRKTNTSTPKVLVPRGLLPEYWKFTFSATQKSLMRLIIVFTLASPKLVSKPVQEQGTEGILKKIGQQRKRQTGRPRGKVYFADIKNHFNEATAKVKFGSDVTIKQEDEASEEELRDEIDNHDDDGFPDIGGDDNDSDWSRGAVSPTGSIESPDSDANIELENSLPTKRRRLRRTRQRIFSENVKHEHISSGESEEEDPTDPEFKSNLEAEKGKRRTPKRPPLLGIKDASALVPCPKCKRKFKDGRGLANHMIGTHKSRPEYVCHVCGHKSSSALARMEHKSKMHKQRRGPRSFKTRADNRQFKTHAEFLQHEKPLHNKNQFVFDCPMCMKQMASKLLFQRHLLKHEKDSSILRLFHCEVCGKTFLEEATLADHFVTVHESVYQCSICGNKFPSAKFLRSHLEVHETKKKNFFCNFCFRAYTNEQYWQVHRKSAHTDKGRIFCDQERCTEEFHHVQELNEHLKIHLQGFKASYTTDAENTQQNTPCLVAGDETKQTDPENQVFTENTEGRLKNDNVIDKLHAEIFKCTTCEWGFLKKYKLTLHKLVHVPWEKEIMGFRCPHSDCSKILKLKDTLISHYNRCHEEIIKSYNCYECGANFSHIVWYKMHLQLHEERNSGRKFICETCGKECQDSVSLNCHRRTHDSSKETSNPAKCEKIKTYTSTGRPRGRPRLNQNVPGQKDKAKTRFSCDICGTSHSGDYELKKHLEKKHEIEEDKTIQCNFCDLKFVHKQTHFLHVKSIHMQKYKFVCDADRCDGVFKNHLQLNEHLIQVHLLESPQMADSGQNTNEIDNRSENIIIEVKMSTEQTEPDDEENPKPVSEAIVKVKSLSYCKVCDWGFVNADFLELHELCHIRNDGGYPCPHCETPFSSIAKLTCHYSTNHGKKLKPYKCLECSNRFFSKESLQFHIGRHEIRRGMAPDEKFVCINCGKRYLDVRCYLIHLKSHDPTNHLACPKGCGEKFPDKTRLTNHLRRKHGLGDKYPCPFCGVSFIYEGETRKHIEYCHDPPKFECETCHEKFRNPRSLKRHINRLHRPESEVAFICSECGNSYKSEEGLNYHIGSMHTPDHLKKFTCPYCPYKTHRRMLWKSHLQTCTKSKGIPYDEARFGKPNKPKSRGKKERKSSPGLNERGRPGKRRQKKKNENNQEKLEEGSGANGEVEQSHATSNLLTCPEEGCVEKFTNRKSLYVHRRRKHGKGERYPCPVCGVSFIFKSYRTKHIKECHEPPKFECEACHQKFRRQASLKKHFDHQHSPQSKIGYMCNECGNSYRTKDALNNHHQSTHTPDHLKKFACPYCSYKTHKGAAWKRHLWSCTKSKGIPYDEARFGKPIVRKSRRKTNTGAGVRNNPNRPSERTRNENEINEEEMEEKTTTDEEDDEVSEESDELEQKIDGPLPLQQPSHHDTISHFYRYHDKYD